MPNLVNKVLLQQLETEVESMGSCLVVAFDHLTVSDAEAVRTKFRDAGVQFRVVKNRLAEKVFQAKGFDLSTALSGKCGVVIAEEEGAIGAAKLVRETLKELKRKPEPMAVTGGVVSGEVIVGPAAANIADMPDKDTVRAQMAGCISGVARGLATCLQAGGPASLARAMQAHIDKEEG